MSGLQTRWVRLLLAAGMVLLVALGVAQRARAVEFDDDGIVAADEVIDDDLFLSSEIVVMDGAVNGVLFASGSTVRINGTVNGDLLVTANEVHLNGHVTGNVAFVGGTLHVRGTVDGSVFFLGSSLWVMRSAEIGRNTYANGFSVEVERGATVGRDAIISAYQATIDGRVDQDVEASVSALEIGGSVGGDVNAIVSEPSTDSPRVFRWPGGPAVLAPGLRVSERAEITGRLTYRSPVEQRDAIESTPGMGVVFEQTAQPEVGLSWQIGQWVLRRVRELVTLLVLGALAVWKAPNLLDRLAEQVRSRPLRSAGWGVAALVAGCVGAAALWITVVVLTILLGIVTLGELAWVISGIGFSGLGLAFALFAMAVVYGGKLIVAYLMSKVLLSAIVPARPVNAWIIMPLGIVLYVLVRSIPLVGWLVSVLAMLVGLGAMWLVYRESRQRRAQGNP